MTRPRTLPMKRSTPLRLVPRASMVAAIASIGMAGIAHAQSTTRPGGTLQVSGVVKFDIAAQPLTSALEAYSTATGVQVLYDSALALGRRSAEARGMLTPQAALTALLRGTSLVAHYTESRDIIIVPAGVQTAASYMPRPSDGPVFALDTLHVQGAVEVGASDRQGVLDYTRALQAEIRGALQRDPRTRSGSYKVGINLWIGGLGAVQQARLFRSTGDRDRDVAIADALQALTVSRAPPGGMPQPVSVMISVKPF